MSRKGLLRGTKFNNRHSTIIKAAQPLVRSARKLPQVSKVVVSIIKIGAKGRNKVQFSSVPAGLKMKVCGDAAVQEFFIYCEDREAVRARLLKAKGE